LAGELNNMISPFLSVLGGGDCVKGKVDLWTKKVLEGFETLVYLKKGEG